MLLFDRKLEPYSFAPVQLCRADRRALFISSFSNMSRRVILKVAQNISIAFVKQLFNDVFLVEFQF